MRATYRVQILHKAFGIIRRSPSFWIDADNHDDLAGQICRKYLALRWWTPNATVEVDDDGTKALITVGPAKRVVAQAVIERATP